MAAVAHCSLPEGSESQWAWIYSPVLVYFLLSHLREKNVRHGLITACQDYWGIPVQEIQTPKEKKKSVHAVGTRIQPVKIYIKNIRN